MTNELLLIISILVTYGGVILFYRFFGKKGLWIRNNGSTILAGSLSYLTGAAVFPSLIDIGAGAATLDSAVELDPYFSVDIPAVMNVMTALVLAFVLGLGMSTQKGKPLNNVAHDFGMFFGFICMLGITMVAAPGVPGGAIMAALGVLQSMLGFDEEAQALMIALYIAMDSFGTACNVTGDGAIAVIMDRIAKGSARKAR
jgi:Na+/H+-dicarboxylate symporter